MMDQLLSKVLVLALSHCTVKCLEGSLLCMSVGTYPCLQFIEHLLCARDGT